MSRIPLATRESVPENELAAYDWLVEKYGAMKIYGPGSVMAHVPQSYRQFEELRDYLLKNCSIPKQLQEIAMMVAARELDCQHMWNSHATYGRRAGVRGDLIDALREKRELTGLTPGEAAVVNCGREYFRAHQVSRGAFQAALEQFGIRGLVELTMIMGLYSMLAVVINAFDTDLPPTRSEPLLPI